MQLKPPRRIAEQLALACSGLLGVNGMSHAAEPWRMDMGVFNYIELERNTGISLLVGGERDMEDGGVFSIDGEIDVITGATPNGATATNRAQTFTMASGVGSYSVAAGELPADDTHMDTRLGITAGLSLPYSDRVSVDYRSHISMEFDFLSLGAGADVLYDVNQHNTQLLLGADFEYDRVHPVGDTPIPFASMAAAYTFQPRGKSSKLRRVQGLNLGVNQVLNKQAVGQFRYQYAEHEGYLNDPYKIISVIEDQDTASLGATLDYVYEERPDVRRVQSVYTALKQGLSDGVLDVSYRYLWDDWDVRSHTVDVKYLYRVDSVTAWQPHLRVYHQTEAEFYRHSLAAGDGLPSYASSDFRLAAFDALTLGMMYSKKLAGGSGYRISAEYYTQIGDRHPADAIGLQRQQDLFPRLHVLVVKYVYQFDG